MSLGLKNTMLTKKSMSVIDIKRFAVMKISITSKTCLMFYLNLAILRQPHVWHFWSFVIEPKQCLNPLLYSKLLPLHPWCGQCCSCSIKYKYKLDPRSNLLQQFCQSIITFCQKNLLVKKNILGKDFLVKK